MDALTHSRLSIALDWMRRAEKEHRGLPWELEAIKKLSQSLNFFVKWTAVDAPRKGYNKPWVVAYTLRGFNR